ncbi:hypothetical protein V7S43_004028 [Phytophthora oleae]|uniref:Chromo domain-containing protein n=1 Tax=Phytophthora oleae TaxID=2107226 RepID=A0ABD3FVS6_9STRA
MVARIIDRRFTPRGYELRVLWLHKQRRSRRYYQRTWEPKELLLEDDFASELNLVERWLESKFDKFDEFCEDDEFGQHTIAADMKGLCLFNAFKKAAHLADRPGIVTDDDINSFVDYERQHYGLDLTRGTSWKLFRVFLRTLRDDGRNFVYKDLAGDNFAPGGRRGQRVLTEVRLLDGLYLVAAYKH